MQGFSDCVPAFPGLFNRVHRSHRPFRALLDINPRTNIVFLTAYPDYSLDAWKTEASGFMLKPMTPESIKEQLKKLRYPFVTGGAVD